MSFPIKAVLSKFHEKVLNNVFIFTELKSMTLLWHYSTRETDSDSVGFKSFSFSRLQTLSVLFLLKETLFFSFNVLQLNLGWRIVTSLFIKNLLSSRESHQSHLHVGSQTTARQYAFNMSYFTLSAHRNHPSLLWEDFSQQSAVKPAPILLKERLTPTQRIKLLLVHADVP